VNKRFCWEKYDRKSPLGKPRRRWKNNEIDLKEID
jgi:hypothetical protein